MNGEYAEFAVLMPVSQFVRLEGEASDINLVLETAASFFLSEWEKATRNAGRGDSEETREQARGHHGGDGDRTRQDAASPCGDGDRTRQDAASPCGGERDTAGTADGGEGRRTICRT